MAKPIVDASSDGECTDTLALAVMRLWGAAMQIEQSFSQADIWSVPHLLCAIETARRLPAGVGWAEPEPNDTEA